MPSALDHIATLTTAHKFYSGAKDVVDATKKMKGFADSNPKDLDAAKKVLGLAKNEYIPLSKFIVDTQKAVNLTVQAGFPDIPNPQRDARKIMEKIAKSAGPNGPGFEKELTAYIKQLTKYELELRERLSYMKFIRKKCDLNIKNFTQIGGIITTTVRLLKKIVVAVPSARNEAGNAILKIMQTGIEKQAPTVVIAYKKLKTLAAEHEKTIAREHIYAKAGLTSAQDKKLKFLVEDAKAFFKKLF